MILTEQNANNMYTRVIHSLIGVASSLNANIDIRRHLNIVADDDEVFFNDYDSSTVDTGWLLFIIASAIAVLSVALLPVSVRIGRYLSSTHLFCKCKSDSTVVDSESSEDEEPPTLSEETESRTWMQNAFAWFLGHLIYRWDKRSSSRKQHRGDRTEAIKRARSKEKRESMLRRIVHASGNEEIELSVIALSHDIDTNQRTGTSRFLRSPQRSVISVAIDSVKKRRRRRRTPQRRGNQINSSSFGPFKTIIRFDHETKRILGLAIPFTVSAVIYTVCDLVIVGFVSQYLGTDAMVAYTMVGLTTGITGGFLGGFVGPLSSLGSCAYGAGNHFLLGQYLQLACVIYTLFQIPMFFVWGAYIGDVLLLFGFNDNVAEIASRYVWLSMTMDVISGIDWVLYEFLEVSEKEVYANVIACIGAVLELPVVWAALHYYDSTLLFLGLVFLATQIVFMLLNICICVRMGWLEKYEDGIFHSLAFRNREALREYLKTAFPLALGSLLSYAEWEILTVLAAVLGPAEAATWAILGYVWDVFESTTGSLGSAGEIRCSYQLGQGKSHLAKLSSYKSMFLALVMSVLSTSIFLSLSTVLPAFLTSDETIQDMLIVLFPLVGLGNVMMSVGMVCWSLVGAQLRYRQATAIATATSVGITLPLGVIFTVVLNYDLKGLTFSVVVGYIMTAMILTSMLLISDWEKLSETIREKMVDKDEEEAEDGAAAPGGTQDTRNTENQCN
mmetsp:Transcript_6080/g.10279  ORF Transcript_6080/g.10279 Transcript_6080/m.10279 type:complete len:729 (+) Transcript_6080:45-2231(+)